MIDLKELVGLAGAPLVVALVEASKRWVTDERWWPILSILWAVALNEALAYVLKTDYAVAAIVGVVVGLSSAGLWDAARAPRKRRKIAPNN